jgi:hypothetical protein
MTPQKYEEAIQMKKRTLSLALTAVLVFALAGSAAYAAEGDFTIENGVLVSYNGLGGHVTIPYGVTEIGLHVFADTSNVVGVTIPEGVTVLRKWAFSRCVGLTSITIPRGVTTIEAGAFARCEALASVTLPETLVFLGDGLFEKCSSLTSITIPGSVTELSDDLFHDCTSLANVNLPGSITQIGYSAFAGCTSLKSITLPGSVKTIWNAAFAGSGLTALTVPNGVTTIAADLFLGCAELTAVTLPSDVETIGNNAFSRCAKLPSVTLPAGVTEIGREAFAYNPKFTLYGASGSYAEKYAKENGLKFSVSTGSPTVPTPAAPAPTTPTAPTVSPTPSTVSVNGAAQSFEAYNIGGNNFFKLRDLAMTLNGTAKQFEVGYDDATRAITLTSGASYTATGGEMTPGDGKAKPANPTTSKVYLDGRELALTAYNIGGNNFFKLRDLLQALDVYVGYDAATNAITIDTGMGYVAE